MALIPYIFVGLVACGYLLFKSNKILIINDEKFACFTLSILVINNLDYMPMIQYGLRVLGIGLASFYIIKHRKIGLTSVSKVIFIYCIVCMFSIIYSVNILETLVKSVEILFDLLLINILVKKYGPEKVWDCIAISLLSLISIMTLGYIFDPADYSKMQTMSYIGTQMAGGMLGANATGYYSAFVLVWALNKSELKKRIFIILLCLFCIFFVQSRTTVACLGVVYIIHMFANKKKFKYILFVSIVVALVFYNFDHIMLYLVRGESENNLQNMTGRTYMWDIAKEYILRKPLLGYGYGAGGYLVSSQINLSHVHNGVYETLLGVGFLGLSVLATAYFIYLIRLGKLVIVHGVEKNKVFLELTVMLTIMTYMDAGLGKWHSPEIIVFYYLICSIDIICRNKNYERKQPLELDNGNPGLL